MIRMPLASPDAVVSQSTALQSKEVAQRLSLPDFIVGRMEPSAVWLEQTQESMIGEPGVISGLSERTFAEVLTDEFVATEKAIAFQPQGVPLPPWTDMFRSALQTEFAERYPGTAVSGLSEEKKRELYQDVFHKLITQSPREIRKEWVRAGMIAARHQIEAAQSRTGAEFVGDPMKKLEYTEDPSIMSPYIDVDPSNGLQATFADIQTAEEARIAQKKRGFFDRMRPPKSKLVPSPATKSHAAELGDRMKLPQMDEWGNVKGADYYSLVGIRFDRDVVNTPRKENRIDGHRLDAVQEAYLAGIHGVGQVDLVNGTIDDTGMFEVARRLKLIGAAMMDASSGIDGRPIIDPKELNEVKFLAKISDPNKEGAYLSVSFQRVDHPSLQAVMTGIDGAPALPPGFKTMSYEQQMAHVMSAIDKRTQEKIARKREVKTLESVETQLTALGEQPKKRELTKAEQADLERISVEVKELERLDTALKDRETARREASEKEQQVIEKEAEIPDAVKARDGLDGKKQELKMKLQAKAELERAKTHVEGTITRLETRISENKRELDTVTQTITNLGLSLSQARGDVTQIQMQIDRLNAEKSVLSAEKKELEDKRTTELDKISTAYSGGKGIGDQLADLTVLITTTETTIASYEATLAVPQNKEKLDAITQLQQEIKLLESRAQAIAKLVGAPVKDQGGTITGYMLPERTAIEQQMRALKSREAKLTIIDPVEQHKREVLTTYKDNVLKPDALMAIRNRAQDPIVDMYDPLRNQNPEGRAVIDAARDRMPWVPGAYLATIRIIGGDEALAYTQTGTKLYEDIAKLIPPDRFMGVFLSNPSRARLLFDTINRVRPQTLAGLSALPQSIFDDVYQSKEVQQAMARSVNAEFIRDVLHSLQDDALSHKLGEVSVQRAETMRKLAYEQTDALITAQEFQETLQTNADRSKIQLEATHQEQLRVATNELRTLAFQNGITPEDLPGLLDIFTQTIIENHIYNPQTGADISAPNPSGGPSMETSIITALQARGFAQSLNVDQMADMVNLIWKEGIGNQDMEAYRAVVEATHSAGIPKENTEYVMLAVRRALLNGNINRSISTRELVDGKGQETPLGTLLREELAHAGVTHLQPEQIAELVNNVGSVPLPIVEADSRELSKHLAAIPREKMQYAATGARRVMERFSLLGSTNPIVEQTLINNPAIKTQFESEMKIIGVNISAMSDKEVADLFESVRSPQQRREHFTISNSDLVAAISSAGLSSSMSADIAGPISIVCTEQGIGGQLTKEYLDANSSVAVAIKDALKASLDPLQTTTIDALDSEKIASLVNGVMRSEVPMEALVQSDHMSAVEDIMHSFIRFRPKDQARLHDAIALGIACTGMDARSARRVQKAIENIVADDLPNWTLSDLQNYLPADVMGYLSWNTISVRVDIEQRFNTIVPPPQGSQPTRFEDIPIEYVRRLAGESLMARRGIVNPPYGQRDSEHVDVSAFVNTVLDREMYAVRMADYKSRYWGSNDPYQLATQLCRQEKLQPQEALIYAQEVINSRMPKAPVVPAPAAT